MNALGPAQLRVAGVGGSPRVFMELNDVSFRFCPRHGPDNQQSAASPPVELLAVSQAMMPRIFMRLLFYLRDVSDPSNAGGLQLYPK